MKTAKINHNGQKLTVRVQGDNEEIKTNTLMVFRCFANEFTPFSYETIGKFKFIPSKHVGDAVGDHPNRDYIEVISPFYKGESVKSVDTPAHND